MRSWCRKTLHLTPGDLPLYRQALRHSSAIPEDRPDLPDNERLEFLGDSVLDTIVGDLLFRTYPEQGEGFLTRMRSKLVSRQQLNVVAQRIQIEEVMESNVVRGHETSVPGNAFEALVGALFLDKGFKRTQKAILALLKEHFDLKAIELEDRDSKSKLLEWGQKKKKKVEFRVREERSGKGRGKLYVAEVLVDGKLSGTGRGPSKKKAEQEAAEKAIARRKRRTRGGKGRGGTPRSATGTTGNVGV